MFSNMIQFFYPNIQKHEIKKYSLLALAFFFTVGTYWLMRLLKDLVLYKLAFPESLGWAADTGRLWIPTVKTISPIFVLALLLLYSKLVDIFDKQKLIYIVISFYIVIFSIITGILLIKNHCGDECLGKTVLATSGILGYLFTESFGSLMVAMFWSFTISASSNDQAKRNFPFIIALGQLGAVLGSSLILINTSLIWPFYAMVVLCLFCLIATYKYLMTTVPQSELQTNQHEKPHASNIFSGFKLLITQSYLIGIFIVSTFYDIVGTILEYQMLSQASTLFDDIEFKWFKGIYGISINVLAFLMALLGTSILIKRLGLRICLLLYPVTFAITLISLYAYYQMNTTMYHLLWATFTVMLIVKASSYAVNNPVKEIMYIPTSKDVKFKTKTIIDMFGSRSAKMTGAQISNYFNVPNNVTQSIHNMMIYGSLISLGLIGIWIAAALYVGIKNKELIEYDEIIE